MRQFQIECVSKNRILNHTSIEIKSLKAICICSLWNCVCVCVWLGYAINYETEDVYVSHSIYSTRVLWKVWFHFKHVYIFYFSTQSFSKSFFFFQSLIPSQWLGIILNLLGKHAKWLLIEILHKLFRPPSYLLDTCTDMQAILSRWRIFWKRPCCVYWILSKQADKTQGKIRRRREKEGRTDSRPDHIVVFIICGKSK